PQGIFAMEMHMSHLARELGRSGMEFKKRYLIKKGGLTVTNGRIHEDVKLPEMIARADEMSGYSRKAGEYSPGRWRGIGLSLFNHGSGFTGNGEQAIIKGVVKIRKRADGYVDLLVSNVEMGQGIQTTFRKIAAMVLEVPVDRIVYNDPNTGIVPDSGPTCASRSIAIVGYLVQEAARKLKARWKEGDVVEVSHQYQQPEGLSWDQDTFQGDAYPSYGWGVNVIEVEVDPLTYEVTTRGIWAVHDVGVAIDEKIVEGQVDGGIIQALGYGHLEKLEARDGRFQQRTMADYVIPTSVDFPRIESTLVDNPYEYGPFGAKGAGELVFNGASAAFADAVQMAVDRNIRKIPVSPEYILEVMSHG
ncbi:MAG: xanthine dehydrogenase family protein molybdopterin-binding subunit, partial [Sediminispirochaetaceae bacterium]